MQVWEGEDQAVAAVGTFKETVRNTYRKLRPLGMRREQIGALLDALLRGSITEAGIEEMCQKSLTDQDAAELEELIRTTAVSTKRKTRSVFRIEAEAA